MKLNSGQVAVITGGAGGIGLALAASLAQRGLRICLIDVEAPALDAAAAQLRAAGAGIDAFACDVSDAAALSAVAETIRQKHDHVDLLVNNAGVGGLLGPIWDSPPEDWSWVIGVNLFGVVNGIRAFVPAMLKRGSGHVLNMASLAGLTSPPFLTPYVASKHAVVALTESLAVEFAAVGSSLKASVACPGNVESRIREADRNRPPHLQASSATSPEMQAKLQTAFDQIMTQGRITAAEAAEHMLAGVERDELYILTHPTEHGPARERLSRLGEALSKTDAD